MTSGLFNTGVTGDSAEITSHDLTVQPSTSGAKLMGDEFSAETFDPDFDMAMLGDLGASFVDPLGDASMDSFTDLTALLTENTFFDHAMEEKAMPVTLTNLDAEVKVAKNTLKRSFAEVEDSSDIAKLSANVGLTQPSSSDHDYSAKRPRMSAMTEEASVENMEEVFLAPAPSPAPSTSSGYGELGENKYKHRREKNNIASKRSREIRKRKFADMESEADRLIVENAHLEKRLVELERLAKRMKEILVAKMAGK